MLNLSCSYCTVKYYILIYEGHIHQTPNRGHGASRIAVTQHQKPKDTSVLAVVVVAVVFYFDRCMNTYYTMQFEQRNNHINYN